MIVMLVLFSKFHPCASYDSIHRELYKTCLLSEDGVVVGVFVDKFVGTFVGAFVDVFVGSFVDAFVGAFVAKIEKNNG